MTHHNEMIKKWKSSPEFMAEYDALEDDFALLEELLKARKHAAMTQEDVAREMGTKAPAVARIESGGGGRKHSPSIATLRRYASAVGCRLKITLEVVRS